LKVRITILSKDILASFPLGLPGCKSIMQIKLGKELKIRPPNTIIPFKTGWIKNLLQICGALL
jgi:hypothetical protein